MTPKSAIDISENTLRNRGKVLDILLRDRTTGRNIIWATDSYAKYGKEYAAKKQIKREHITGVNGKMIQPRAAKSREEQTARTKGKAEVFTPLRIVKEMNTAILRSLDLPDNHTWRDFIATTWLEITCGEAPFIASRYNPTANTGAIIKLENRVGFLDMKLQAVGAHASGKQEWLEHAEAALKASYGYEWQGDSLLIARENILYTMNDFYADFCARKLKRKTKQHLTDEQLEHFAKIISWNIWQMDGIKQVVPMSCKNTDFVIPKLPFPGEADTVTKEECLGCKTNDTTRHNGRYAIIMNWKKKRSVQFARVTTLDRR